jgi:hypothetical protein
VILFVHLAEGDRVNVGSSERDNDTALVTAQAKETTTTTLATAQAKETTTTALVTAQAKETTQH